MENKLTVKVGQADVTVKEYHGKRVVTFKEIDECHGRPVGTARKRFNDNKKHLVEGEDFFIVKPADIQMSEKRTTGIAPEDVNNRGTAFITESGYLMLVKSFTDDLAWQVQRQLVNTYFRKSQADQTLKLQIQQERAAAMLLNAKVRALQFFSRHAKDRGVSEMAVQVFGATSLEELTGIRTDGRPECGKLYTATEIANSAHCSKQRVGKVAKANGLQTDDKKYGVWMMDKSRYSGKQVPSFRYNETGRERLLELLRA